MKHLILPIIAMLFIVGCNERKSTGPKMIRINDSTVKLGDMFFNGFDSVWAIEDTLFVSDTIQTIDTIIISPQNLKFYQ